MGSNLRTSGAPAPYTLPDPAAPRFLLVAHCLRLLRTVSPHSLHQYLWVKFERPADFQPLMVGGTVPVIERFYDVRVAVAVIGTGLPLDGPNSLASLPAAVRSQVPDGMGAVAVPAVPDQSLCTSFTDDPLSKGDPTPVSNPAPSERSIWHHVVTTRKVAWVPVLHLCIAPVKEDPSPPQLTLRPPAHTIAPNTRLHPTPPYQTTSRYPSGEMPFQGGVPPYSPSTGSADDAPFAAYHDWPGPRCFFHEEWGGSDMWVVQDRGLVLATYYLLLTTYYLLLATYY